jgi:diadenosine tetraphosphatase ApaH/serine/threonine PP2A family protein phosphatase
VGYGADPAAVVDRAAAEIDRGALAVLGNHDAAVLGDAPPTMHPSASRAIAWTRGRLTVAQRELLARLPLAVRDGAVLLVHASAHRPSSWEYVTDAPSAARCMAAAPDVPYVACGHVHAPALHYVGAAARPVAFRPVAGVAIPVAPHRRWLVLPGAVGQPRDGTAAAAYAILDLDRASLTFHRVPYDWQAAAAKVRAAGLPESLAVRLERGE